MPLMRNPCFYCISRDRYNFPSAFDPLKHYQRRRQFLAVLHLVTSVILFSIGDSEKMSNATGPDYSAQFAAAARANNIMVSSRLG